MLDEKIDELIGQLSNCDLRTSVGVDKAKRVLRLALREQDRDAIHVSKKTVGHITNLIADEVGFFNGWQVSRETMLDACEKAAKRIERYLKRKHMREFGPKTGHAK